MDEVKITYETLYDTLRQERNNNGLQKFSNNFYVDVVEYLKDKHELLKKSKGADLFGSQESQNIQLQLQNVKKILNEIYVRREKKIIDISINKSRTKSGLVDTSALLEEEKKFYDELLLLLNKYRDSIFNRVLNLETPEGSEVKEKELESTEILVKVKLLDDVAKFISKDLKTYGPYEKDTTTEIPEEVARILLNTNRAVNVEKDL